jgi:hypothetical protein
VNFEVAATLLLLANFATPGSPGTIDALAAFLAKLAALEKNPLFLFLGRMTLGTTAVCTTVDGLLLLESRLPLFAIPFFTPTEESPLLFKAGKTG